jgi:hypothetical protein
MRCPACGGTGYQMQQIPSTAYRRGFYDAVSRCRACQGSQLAPPQEEPSMPKRRCFAARLVLGPLLFATAIALVYHLFHRG